MPIITLTTDLGTKDHYVSTLKATIIRELDEANIIDISHNIPPFDLRHAAFVLKNSYKEFPQNSIHIIGVNAEYSNEQPHLIVYADNHYFIAADNGVFSLILDVKPDKIVELNLSQKTDNENFPTKDVFARAACHIARGGTMDVIGHEITKYNNERSNIEAIVDSQNNTIKGIVMHIDNYGNAITNIKQDLFKKVAKGRNYSIHIGQKEHYSIGQLSSKYNEVPLGEALAIFISTGLLTVALNQGSAASLMGVNLNDIIRIEFHD